MCGAHFAHALNLTDSEPEEAHRIVDAVRFFVCCRDRISGQRKLAGKPALGHGEGQASGSGEREKQQAVRFRHHGMVVAVISAVVIPTMSVAVGVAVSVAVRIAVRRAVGSAIRIACRIAVGTVTIGITIGITVIATAIATVVDITGITVIAAIVEITGVTIVAAVVATIITAVVIYNVDRGASYPSTRRGCDRRGGGRGRATVKTVAHGQTDQSTADPAQ